MKFRILFTICAIFFLRNSCLCQKNPPVDQQQYESLAESNGDAEITDDNYLQELNHFIKHPINLNTTSAEQLGRIKLLTALQIDNFISYRKLLGKLVNIHELQAIPGWNLNTIEKILPFVFVSELQEQTAKFKERFLLGDKLFLSRYSRILEKSKGYLIGNASSRNHYLGGPDKLFLRYKYRFGNLLEYGITGSKDAGEQFFKGAQKSGFDFYSIHLFARNIALIKSIAIGDFTVNMGQGLIQWQSLGFRKNTEVINIERQSEILKPYNSSGQVNFHRGLGVLIEKNHFRTMGFISFRKLDANFKSDSIGQDFVSSIQSSGYHRTPSEIKHKNKLDQIAFGGNISYNKDQFHMGINNIFYYFGTPIKKSTALYNKYAFSGSRLINNSLDFSYTYKNVHSFGEVAVDDHLNLGMLTGALVAINKTTDFSILYRNISKKYRSLYSNSFTENSIPVNEMGCYAGLALNLSSNIFLSGYYDIFSFPWIKYRVDMPSSGSDYLVQLKYLGGKEIKIYSKYRMHRKPVNYNPDRLPVSPVVALPSESWRTSLNFNPSGKDFEIGAKIELSSYNKNSGTPGHGLLFSLDAGYYPKGKPFYLNASLERFEVNGPNSRIYTFESDVLYSVSVPSVSGKGIRGYLNLNYDLNKKLAFYLKLSQNYYPQTLKVGSGLDEINGDRKTEVKLEFLYKFQ